MEILKKYQIVIFIIILIAGIWIWSNYGKIGKLEDTITNLEDQVSALESKIQNLEDQNIEYQSSLEEANNNIEEANEQIEEAQSNAWSSYYEMGEALDNLTTVDTVAEP